MDSLRFVTDASPCHRIWHKVSGAESNDVNHTRRLPGSVTRLFHRAQASNEKVELTD